VLPIMLRIFFVAVYRMANFPFFTVSISKASMPRPLWSVGEKLKMPAVRRRLEILDGGPDRLLVRGFRLLDPFRRMRKAS